jgi:pimeloyl-ACP methyl ester carboxylesterase
VPPADRSTGGSPLDLPLDLPLTLPYYRYITERRCEALKYFIGYNKQSFTTMSKQRRILLKQAILALLLAAAHAEGNVTASSTTIVPVELNANNLTFECNQLISGAPEEAHNVVLLHGFPYNKEFYDPLLESWNASSKVAINAVACDLRGYSPGASPDSIDDYRYDLFVDDVAGLADAAGYSTFHLIGHDQGAIVGWLASSSLSDRILSYTALAVPHNDLLSKALCGDNVDEEQVIAVNYFNQFSVIDSATTNDGAMSRAVALINIFSSDNVFESPEDFQKSLWWYNTGIPRVVSRPRVLNASEVPSDFAFLRVARLAVPLEPRPCVPQEEALGEVTIPVLFVCGAQDPFLLCNRPYATPTEGLIPDYTYHEAATCGHGFFSASDCDNSTDTEEVIKMITDFIAMDRAEGSDEDSGGGVEDGKDEDSEENGNDGNAGNGDEPVSSSGRLATVVASCTGVLIVTLVGFPA